MLGFSVQYVEDGKVRLFVWHVLSMSHVPLDRHDEVVRVLRRDLQYFEEMSNQCPRSRRTFEAIEEFLK